MLIPVTERQQAAGDPQMPAEAREQLLNPAAIEHVREVWRRRMSGDGLAWDFQHTEVTLCSGRIVCITGHLSALWERMRLAEGRC